MISRVAEHCYWMSRYLERAENTARILEVNETLLLDFVVPIEQQWKPLLIISGIHDVPGEPDSESVQNYLTWERDNPSSIASSLAAARENARIIREVISADMWERINYYYLWMQDPATWDLYNRRRTDFYCQIKRINQLIHGITEGTMSHDEAWDFYLLGKYLERACQTARILDVKYHILLPTPEHVGTPVDSAHWMAILTSCSGYEPFHKKRLVGDLGISVADFLVFDPLFPRSVRYCLARSQRAAHAITGRPITQPGNEVEHAINSLVRWLNLVKVDDFVKAGLHEELTSIIDRIHGIGGTIHRTYFDVNLEDWGISEGGPQDPLGPTMRATAPNFRECRTVA
ncbi:MAG: alpha-E domain-containing protein [Planctomycetaceae bacterium]